VRSIKLTESEDRVPVGSEPESVSVMVEFVPEDSDNWGTLEPLRGTTWEDGVSEVDADSFSHALHGRLSPLLKKLGRNPVYSARRVSEQEGVCDFKGNCIKFDKNLCRPGGEKGNGWRKKYGPFDCYQPPLQGASIDVTETFLKVALAWKEGIFVIVVKGEGFNLR
jgi:hypothetical protein